MDLSTARKRLYLLGPGLVAATSFGVCDALAKLIFIDGADALTLALIRGVVGIGIMYAYLRIQPPEVPHTRRMRDVALGLGVLFAVIVYGLFEAIELLTVPVAVLTYFVYPLLTGIGGAIFGIDRLGWRGVLAAVAAFFGLALTIGAYPQHLSVAGIVLALGAALSARRFCCRPRRNAGKPTPASRRGIR